MSILYENRSLLSIRKGHPIGGLFLLANFGIEPIQWDSPVDCRSIPARRDRLLNVIDSSRFHHAKTPQKFLLGCFLHFLFIIIYSANFTQLKYFLQVKLIWKKSTSFSAFLATAWQQLNSLPLHAANTSGYRKRGSSWYTSSPSDALSKDVHWRA